MVVWYRMPSQRSDSEREQRAQGCAYVAQHSTAGDNSLSHPHPMSLQTEQHGWPVACLLLWYAIR